MKSLSGWAAITPTTSPPTTRCIGKSCKWRTSSAPELRTSSPTKRPSADNAQSCLTNLREKNSSELGDFHALLLHGIALAQRDGVAKLCAFFPERFEIDRHAKGRADFILPAVTPADRATLIVKNKQVWPQKIDNLLRLHHQRFLVFQKRKYRAFDR